MLSTESEESITASWSVEDLIRYIVSAKLLSDEYQTHLHVLDDLLAPRVVPIAFNYS